MVFSYQRSFTGVYNGYDYKTSEFLPFLETDLRRNSCSKMESSSLPLLFRVSILPFVSDKVPSQESVDSVCSVGRATLIHKKIVDFGGR